MVFVGPQSCSDASQPQCPCTNKDKKAAEVHISTFRRVPSSPSSRGLGERQLLSAGSEKNVTIEGKLSSSQHQAVPKHRNPSKPGSSSCKLASLALQRSKGGEKNPAQMLAAKSCHGDLAKSC